MKIEGRWHRLRRWWSLRPSIWGDTVIVPGYKHPHRDVDWEEQHGR